MITIDIAFLVLAVVYIMIQIFSIILDRYYLLHIGWLLMIVIVGLVSLFELKSINGIGSYLRIGFLILFILVSSILLAVNLSRPYKWAQKFNKILRTQTILEYPHDDFVLKSKDGVKIKGYHIHNLADGELRESVVIIAHGGFRNKDIFVKYLLSAWLSDHHDIIAFDFRGHGESGSEWTGDGKTILDLEAVIEFAKNKGYKKIGIYGRSMGAWTTILTISKSRDVNALVLTGMPIISYKELPEFNSIAFLLGNPIVKLIVKSILGVRLTNYIDIHTSFIEELKNTEGIPTLLIYNQVDPSAAVIGDYNFWNNLCVNTPNKNTIRNIKLLRITAQEIFEKLGSPKKLLILPGVAHVYSFNGLHSLLTTTSNWFDQHLDT